MNYLDSELYRESCKVIAALRAEVAELKVIKARFKEVNDARLENTELALTLEGDNAELLAAVKVMHVALTAARRYVPPHELMGNSCWPARDRQLADDALAAGAKWVKP